MGRHSSRGFTLIELLVVIAIIVVLAGLIVPVFFKARGAARKSKCANNMRQSAMAIELYVQDHDDMLPMTRHNLDWRVDPVVPWYDAIEPYTRNRAIYRCPDLPAQPVNIGPACAVFTMCGLAGTHAVFQFDDPAATFLFGDISDKRHSDPPYYTHKPERLCSIEICESPAELHLDPRHSGKLNVAFLDGHTKPLTLQQACSKEITWTPTTGVAGSTQEPCVTGAAAR